MAAEVEDVRRLADAFESAVRRSAEGSGQVVVLYSGGLDSSVLAWCLRDAFPRLFTVGAPGSFDLAQAESGARLLGLPHQRFEVHLTDVEAAMSRWQPELQSLHEPSRSVLVTELLALENAPPGRILVGQGADELFLGYAHFRGLTPTQRRVRAENDLRVLLDLEWPRVVRIARSIHRELESPYLDPQFLATAASLPGSLAQAAAETKPMLRSVARALGLPSALVDRPKKAMQYGTGVARLVRSVQRPA